MSEPIFSADTPVAPKELDYASYLPPSALVSKVRPDNKIEIHTGGGRTLLVSPLAPKKLADQCADNDSRPPGLFSEKRQLNRIFTEDELAREFVLRINICTKNELGKFTWIVDTPKMVEYYMKHGREIGKRLATEDSQLYHWSVSSDATVRDLCGQVVMPGDWKYVPQKVDFDADYVPPYPSEGVHYFVLHGQQEVIEGWHDAPGAVVPSMDEYLSQFPSSRLRQMTTSDKEILFLKYVSSLRKKTTGARALLIGNPQIKYKGYKTLRSAESALQRLLLKSAPVISMARSHRIMLILRRL